MALGHVGMGGVLRAGRCSETVLDIKTRRGFSRALDSEALSLGATTAAAAAAALSISVAAESDLSKLSRQSVTRRAQSVDRAASSVINASKRFVSNDAHSSSASAAAASVCPMPLAQEWTESSFVLPNLMALAPDLRAFLEKELLEIASLVTLEQAGRLNWWFDMGVCSRLWPLLTSGDGNCLLHAASLAMLGRHDRTLTLRRALHNRMLRDAAPFYRRWRWQTTSEHRSTTGLELSEVEWRAEWLALERLSSPTPKTINLLGDGMHGGEVTVGDQYDNEEQVEDNMESEFFGKANGHLLFESLEEIHVFALANELRRPVIVVADVVLKDLMGDALAPIPFGGVYLPLLERPENCCRDPLLLTFDASHFSALVAMDTNRLKESSEGESSNPVALPNAIPLVTPDFELLRLHFAEDPGPNWRWDRDGCDVKRSLRVMLNDEQRRCLLGQYLNLDQLPLSSELFASSERLQSSSSSASLNAATDSSLSEGSNSRASTLERCATARKSSKPSQSVVDKVGSLGKALRRSLRRAFRMETSRKLALSTLNGRPCVVASSFANSSSSHLTAAKLAQRDSLLVARLGSKRPSYVDDMVRRYMDSAEKRFHSHNTLHKRRSLEIVRLAEERRRSALSLAPCANTGCSMYASVETNFLCSLCFKKQQIEVVALQLGQSVCRSNGCANFGSAELEGFCSGCHLARSCVSISTAVAAATLDLRRSDEVDVDSLLNSPHSVALEVHVELPMRGVSPSQMLSYNNRSVASPCFGVASTNFLDTTFSDERDADVGKVTAACRSSSCIETGLVELDFYCQYCFTRRQRNLLRTMQF